MSPTYNVLRGFFRLSVFFSIAAAFAAVIMAFLAARDALDTLEILGYPLYLGVAANNTWLYLTSCLNNSACYPNFVIAWKAAYPTWLLLVVPVLIVAIAFLGVMKSRARMREHDPATGMWSTPRHLIRRGYLRHWTRWKSNKNLRGYVGMLPNGKMLQVPENTRFSHALVLGGPGAKKSTGYHWQNILMDAQDGISVIIFDLKFPDPKGGFVSALPYFEKQGYDVYAFTPYEDVTHHLPLIQDAVHENTAREIAEMFIPPSEDGGAAFYKRTERRVLTGLLMHAAACNISLTQLHTIMQQGGAEVRRFVNGKGNPEYQPAVAEVSDIVSALLNAEKDKQQGMLDGLIGALEFFANPQLGNATRRSPDPWLNIPLDKIAVNKSILYVGLPQKNVDGGSGKMLLQLIKRMIDSALSQTAYDNYGAVPNPVSFYLDEFPSLGKLPNVESNFATMRSRKIAYHVTIQNISQGKAIYTDAGFKSFFTSNFQTIMLFPSFIKFDDAEYISKILGNVMTTMYGVGASRGGQHDTHSSNEREATRPLVTIDEMQTWSPDEAIVILNGVPHTKVIVPGIFQEKVKGVKNPFTPIWKTLDKELNARQYVIDLTNRGKQAWLKNKLAASLAVAKAHGGELPTPAPTQQEPSTETTQVTTPSPALAPEPPPVVDHRTLPVDPSTLHYVTTESGKKFIPRDVINKLVDHITRANTSIKVEGDKASHKVETLHVPNDIINTVFSPEEIVKLTEQGYISERGHVTLIHFNKDGLLDPSRATYLLKKLPVATKTPQTKRMSHKKAQAAFNEAILNAISQNLGAHIEYNATQNAVQRVSFNRYALLPQDNPELEQAWAYHKLVTFTDGQAHARRKGLAQLPEATTQLIVQRYYADRGEPVPTPTVAKSATPAPQTPVPQTRTEHAPAGQHSPAPAPTPQAPQQSQQALKKPLRPNKRPKATPSPSGPAGQPQQAQPAVQQATATPAPVSTEEQTQATTVGVPAEAPLGQAVTTPPVSNAPANPPVQPAPAPAAHMPANETPALPQKAASTPPAQVPAGAPTQPFTWTTHPTDKPATAMMLIHDPLTLNRLRAWIKTHTSALLIPGEPDPTRAVEGALEPSKLHFNPDAYATASEGAPTAPVVPKQFGRKTASVVDGLRQEAWIIRVSSLMDSTDPQGQALAAWIHSIATRIEGHPNRDPSLPALPGLEYTPSVLTIPPKTLKSILRATQNIDLKRIHPPPPERRLMFAEAVHVLVPDGVPEVAAA